MKNLEKAMEKVFNTLGNEYLIDNFDAEPFEFKVKIRRGNRKDDLQDYIIELYSIPNIPETFNYKNGKRNGSDGIHISVFKNKLREFIKYVDPSFGEFGKTVGIRIMNRK